MTTKSNKYEIPLRSDEFLQSDAVCEELEIEVTQQQKENMRRHAVCSKDILVFLNCT